MPILLRSTYLSIFTHIVIFSAYGWWVFGVVGVEYFTGPEALVRVGRTLAVLILGGYALEFIVQIATFIVKSKASGDTKSFYMVDERDKQILAKSLSNSYHVLTIGIFLAIAAMAMGWSLFKVFNLIVLAFALAYAMEFATKIYLYKRGF